MIEEPVVMLRLMGNPEKTERLILDWFSISFSYVVNCFRFSFLQPAATFGSLAKAYTRWFAPLSIR
jgi:hypothetical protein